MTVQAIKEPSRLADTIVVHWLHQTRGPAGSPETIDPKERLERLFG